MKNKLSISMVLCVSLFAPLADSNKTLVVNALRFKDHFSHATVDEALELVNEINPQQAFLTHVSHEIGLHQRVNEQLPNNVQLAFDGLELFI